MTATPPSGYHTLTPRVFVSDPTGLVAFLKQVFAATGEVRPDVPAEVRIGDSLLMVSGTEVRNSMPACLYVYVDDVDATYRRAIGAGAASLEEPSDLPYGDRRAMVQDAWANLWQIAARLERR
jgi:PhnB protein